MNILTTNNVILNFAHLQSINVFQRSTRNGIVYQVQAKYVGGTRTEAIRQFTESIDADDMVADIFSSLAKGKRTYTASNYKAPQQPVEPPTDEPDADDASALADLGDQTPTA